jgi:hypothetical protein
MRICRQRDPAAFTPVAGNRTACWLHHPAAETPRAAFLAARPAP